VNYRVDDKGKFFTAHVTKLRLPITACIGNWIIEGTVHLKSDNRLKDELNDGEMFIAITQARVWQVGSDKLIYEPEVLIVHKNEIAWIFPREATVPPDEASTAPDLR
jgi:hypothetical protein